MGAHELAVVNADAKNRSWRTALQGLGIDVLVAIAVVILAWLPDADLAAGVAWVILGTAVVKSVLTAAASYVMRRFALGPAPVQPPAE